MREDEYPRRLRMTFRGVVQGVGFRPSLYRCAKACGLTGFVRNMRSHVIAEIQGPTSSVSRFRSLLPEYLPEAAKLEGIFTEGIPPTEESSFRIEESMTSDFTLPPIPPDLAICGECRQELLNPGNRRYLYPFITCTQCGPRYTITSDTPFDREQTSMAAFEQCPECLEEYRNPGDRRFHAQTNSCAKCGPSLYLSSPRFPEYRVPEPGQPDIIPAVIRALGEGKIIAIQGLGGFHLAADPSVPGSLEKLRGDKLRRTKPFAIMVRDPDAAAEICRLTREDRNLLSSPLSPILVLPKREDIPRFYDLVSDTDTLGVMLPYTPLHTLLFFHPDRSAQFRSLVMTSGNMKNEPIVTEPAEAFQKLSSVADIFLSTDRQILFRTDDSVIRSSGGFGENIIIRRSRGYVPGVLELKTPVLTSTLATGGDLKNAPALALGTSVSMLPYMGDCDDPLVQKAFEEGILRTLKLYKLKPGRIVSDLHPLYYTSGWASSFEASSRIDVQHHWAHLLSVMAEHGQDEVIGAAFDGTGYGTDGTSWGGEFLWAKRDTYKRLGTFNPFPLPGGDSSVLHPGRIAFSLLVKAVGCEKISRHLGLPYREAGLLADMIAKGINSPLTSAVGRLLDAAAFLLRVVDDIYYEGEGPIKLESEALRWLARSGVGISDDWDADDKIAGSAYAGRIEALMPLIEPGPDLAGQGVAFVIDPLPLYMMLMEAGAKEGRGAIAYLVHKAFADALVRGLKKARESTGVSVAALSGGVFQNLLLRRLAIPVLEREGFTVLLNDKIPCNDGGLALGQVYCTLP